MPIRASLHFHKYLETTTLILSLLCQCPFGLLFISTDNAFDVVPQVQYVCQCPFGLLFISTVLSDRYVPQTGDVSMPIRASLHFHWTTMRAERSSINLCQCPFGLLFISTMVCMGAFRCTHSCVNAHSGFSSFPQHPSESRRNKAFSRPFLQVFI